jgi:protein TonB
VKRFILPAILAIAIHAVVFSIEGRWFDPPSLSNLHTKRVTLSLAYLPSAAEEKKQPVSPVAPEPLIKEVTPEPVVKLKPPPPQKTPPKRVQPRPKIVKRVETPNKKQKNETASKPASAKRLVENVIPLKTIENNWADLPDYIPAMPRNTPPETRLTADRNISTAANTKLARMDPQVISPSPAAIITEAIPLYKVNPAPKYPRIAKKRGYQGVVLLDVYVTADGRAKEVKLFHSSHHSVLDKAAIKSVQKWLFEPGKKDGKKVAMWVKVPIRFELTR